MSNEAVAHTVLDVAENLVEAADTVAKTAMPAQRAVNNVSRAFFKVVGKARRFSPEILMVAGVTGVITAGVLACRATLKLEGVVAEAEQDIHVVKETRRLEEYATELEFNKALTKVYTKRALQVGKLYTPALSVGLVGIGCLLGSHGIMSQRNVAMAAAVKAGESAFAEYRRRVVEELGEEKDKELRFGLVEKEIPTFGENGEQIGTKKLTDVEMDGWSSYARIFDESNEMWSRVPGINQMTLSNQQNWLNNRLEARGYVFLNDVYKALGFPATPEGQVTGWLRKDHEDSKDGYVDFGLFEIEKQAKRDFINGFENSVILDFNVDGIIWDKI